MKNDHGGNQFWKTILVQLVLKNVLVETESLSANSAIILQMTSNVVSKIPFEIADLHKVCRFCRF